MTRGYFGIGIFNGKDDKNVGVLWRCASIYQANFIFTIGGRYKRDPGDTPNTPRHTPLFQYGQIASFPEEATLVCIEQVRPQDWHRGQVSDLTDFKHPERAIYLLGAEDHGIPHIILRAAAHIVQIPTPHTIIREGKTQAYPHNVAIAGSLVMHDRYLKLGGKK